MERNQISIIEDVFAIIANSKEPQKTLDAIVILVAEKLKTDVCSVYVFDSGNRHLILRATHGLNPATVGQISMKMDEGLTGLVLEEMGPVFVTHPENHPRFKFFDQSGEKKYQTFLGLPLVYHQKILGVLVIQTIDEHGIDAKDIATFTNIASQVSTVVAYTGLLEDRQQQLIEKPVFPFGKKFKGIYQDKKYLKGIGVSDWFARGHASYFTDSIGFDHVKCKGISDIGKEITRIKDAFARSAKEVSSVIQKTSNLSDQDEAILEAHLMYFNDQGFINKIINHIRKGYCAEYALKTIVSELVAVFRKVDDPYLAERSADIENIGKQVLQHLIGLVGPIKKKFNRPTILVAADISPVDLIKMRQKHLKGIVLSEGGKTSHTVILAKSFEIPIIVNVEELLDTVKEDEFLIIDGSSGFVFANPPQEIIDEYSRIESEREQQYHKFEELRDIPAQTLDGFKVDLGANIGLLSDVELVKKYGADHIGLYRTEFPFLVRDSFPSEDSQFKLYVKIIENAKDRAITIRTIDTGGDKFLSYLDYPKEDNPYLGWRSIRVSLELEDIFRTQIRAILRASAYGKIKILFPMITVADEIRKIKLIVDQEKNWLKQKKIKFDPKIEIGIMVEVPAAARILDRLLKYVDFVSIGTNDLIQYLMAVDRNNKKIAELYDALHPALISTIFDIITTCKKAQKPVSICGEATSNLYCVYLFLGMGASQLSMNSSSIPIVKGFINDIKQKFAKQALKQVMQMEDATSIKSFLNDEFKKRSIQAPVTWLK